MQGMWNKLKQCKKNRIRELILKDQNNRKTQLSCIEEKIKSKYGNKKETKENIRQQQTNKLLEKIKMKQYHGQMFRNSVNRQISTHDSSLWLRKGKLDPKSETALTMMQDRNIHWITGTKCKLCGEKNDVEHIASLCQPRSKYEYTRRHDEVVKCVSMMISKRYGFTNTKAIRSYKIKSIQENEKCKLWIDEKIKTDVKLRNYRPDIVAIDKKKKFGIIIDVAVVNPSLITSTENEKISKYDPLSDQLKHIYKLKKVKVIPYVIGFDGSVSTNNRNYTDYIRLDNKTKAYIQARVMKMTTDIITNENRSEATYKINERSMMKRRSALIEEAIRQGDMIEDDRSKRKKENYNDEESLKESYNEKEKELHEGEVEEILKELLNKKKKNLHDGKDEGNLKEIYNKNKKELPDGEDEENLKEIYKKKKKELPDCEDVENLNELYKKEKRKKNYMGLKVKKTVKMKMKTLKKERRLNK